MSGGVRCPDGTDAEAALALRDETGFVKGLEGTEPISNDDLLALEWALL